MASDQDTDRPENWVTIPEAVQMTGRSDRTLRRWVHDGKLPSERRGARLYVNLAGLAIKMTGADADTGQELDQARREVDKLTGQIVRLQDKVDSLQAFVVDKNADIKYLRQAHAASLELAANTQRLLEAPPRERSWHWPWQRGDTDT